MTIQFTEEEKKKLAESKEAQRFIADAPDDWSVSYLRAQLRERFLRPPTLAEQLKEVAPLSHLVEKVADLERNFAKLTKMRPISELRQEPWTWAKNGRDGDPYRNVIFWWLPKDPGKAYSPKCRLGYRSGQGKFILEGCGGEAESGNPTHFSELPSDAAE